MKASSTLLSWDDIAGKFGKELASSAMAVIDARARKGEATAMGAGFRHFLGWLDASKPDAAHLQVETLVSMLSGGDRSILTAAQQVHLVIAAMEAWLAELRDSRVFTLTTITGYVSRAAVVLEWLGESGDNRYPPFLSRFVSLPKIAGDTPSLAGNDWPELSGLKAVARERRALGLVRADVMKQFRRHEAIFQFGQKFLYGDNPPVGANETAWRNLKTLLQAERRSWLDTGRSLLYAPGEAVKQKRELYRDFLSIDAWKAVDMPGASDIVPRSRWPGMLSVRQIWSILQSCLGSTRQATALVMYGFCCDAGWNNQTICDVPRQPFLFETKNECGLVSSAFVESFKNRAGHEVLAYLESGSKVLGLMEDRVKSGWSSSIEDYDPYGNEDGYLLLRGDADDDGSLISLLRRYEAMTDCLRPCDLDCRLKDKFFIYATPSHGLWTPKGVTASDASSDFANLREGVSFQAIRKTFLSLKMREVGSVTALRPVAGHSRTGVLMGHYLNSDDIKAELDESIRFFQNACQSMIVDNSAAFRLDMSPGDLAWFRKLADFSGIAAMWTAPPVCDVADSEFRFDPTEDNLKNLFLAHLALRLCRSRLAAARWKVQALPLLGAVKAVGRKVFEKGLRTAYIAAARKAHRDLMAGEIVLPVLVEV